MHTELASPPSVGVVDGDNVVLTQSWLNQIPLLALFIIAEIVVISLLVTFPVAMTTVFDGGMLSLPASSLTMLPLLIALKAAFHIYNERLVLTPDYMIHVTGRLSWRERSSRLPYEHIQEIETAQSVLQKICGLGDLLVTPLGGTSSTSIQIQGIRSPRAVKDRIRSYIK